jgi:formate hydrogenlyase subunit 3/multisubunit Na+/H+ antiporter MnhD subunit
MVNRAVAITLLAASLSILRQRAATDDFRHLQGMARRLPIATFGLMLGGLALAGFPLTAEFPTHWAISRSVLAWAQRLSTALGEGGAVAAGIASGSPWIWMLTLLALLASSAGIVIGQLRGLSAMLGTASQNDVARQPTIASFMVAGLAAVTVLLGLYPQFFLGLVRSIVEAFSLY